MLNVCLGKTISRKYRFKTPFKTKLKVIKANNKRQKNLDFTFSILIETFVFLS